MTTALMAGVCMAALTGCGGVGGAPQPPPVGLTYSVPSATYLAGVPIEGNSPSLAGGEATSFSVSPGLPVGLVLDRFSGGISGTPVTGQGPLQYVVTASNAGGRATAQITIAVTAASCHIPADGTLTQCKDYGGPGWGDIRYWCGQEGGTWVVGSCPALGRAGRCVGTASNGQTQTFSLYNVSAADGQAACSLLGTIGAFATTVWIPE